MGRQRRKRAATSTSTPATVRQASRNSYTWPLACLASVVIAAGSIYVYQRTALNSPALPPFLVVQREHLSNRSYREIADKRTPLIITGTVADKWLARNSFTPSFLAQKLPYVMAHRQESKGSFVTFHDNKPLEPLVNERWEDFNVKVNVTLPELLAWDRAEGDLSTGPFLYFSQDIATLKSVFHDIMEYVQPLNELILSPENVQVNLWIGQTGIVTHTHYDCTFNFFVQLRGRKRFTLFPPNSSLYLYPCLHPHYGHSQVDILDPKPSHFPEFSMVSSRVAEVGPGDMLVVPPFWFHHVETLEQSVSVNVWSDAPEYSLLNKIYEQPIPFEESWRWEDLAMAAKTYIEMSFQSGLQQQMLRCVFASVAMKHELLHSLVVGSSHEFIGKLVTQRYEPVVLSGNLNVNETAFHKVKEFCSSVNWKEKMSELTSSLGRGIGLLQPLFKHITVSTLDICLGNYVEHLLHLTVGLEHVYPFLKNCF